MATDSIYIGKSALKKLEGVEAYKPHLTQPKGYCRICPNCHDEATPRPLRDGIAPAQGRDKGEQLYMPMEHAAYLEKPEYIKNKKDLAPNTAPCHDDSLSRHRLSYLNGGGGNGKTTRSIKLFRTRKPLVLTRTHRPAKEMRGAQAHRRSNRRLAKSPRGVKAQTNHSFFRWSGQTDWTPERMGQKFIPRVIIWDEVCTVPLTILKTFLTWLGQRGVQVICCGDQGQPNPDRWRIAAGLAP